MYTVYVNYTIYRHLKLCINICKCCAYPYVLYLYTSITEKVLSGSKIWLDEKCSRHCKIIENNGGGGGGG